MTERVHMRIYGKVQGVFFRATAREQARMMDVTGWIRNLRDGSVELVAEGKRDDLELLIKWCNEGSAAAKVEKVEVEWQQATGDFSQFSIR